MRYRARSAGDYTVIHWTGDVDMTHSPDARDQMLKYFEDGRHVLVDLSKVTHIDSSGVAVLVEGYQVAKKSGRRFGLVGVGKAALSVLQLANLDKVLPLHTSVASATGAKD